MSTLTRERIEQLANGNNICKVTREERIELARIALASLEAEPVGEIVLGEYDDSGCYPDAKVVCIAADGQADWENFKDGTRLYAAPPSVVAIDERAAFNVWNNDENLPIAGVGAKNAAWLAWQARSRLAAAPVPVSVPNEVNTEDCPEFVKYDITDVDEAWASGYNACRAAMLQGAENVESLHAVKAAPLLDSSAKGIELQHADFQSKDDGNSPVIPDGWVMVPVEPTTNQWAAGMQAFDSGMDKVTRVYKAMIAAAPQQEVK